MGCSRVFTFTSSIKCGHILILIFLQQSFFIICIFPSFIAFFTLLFHQMSCSYFPHIHSYVIYCIHNSSSSSFHILLPYNQFPLNFVDKLIYLLIFFQDSYFFIYSHSIINIVCSFPATLISPQDQLLKVSNKYVPHI